jgi:hypothetical protein
MTLSSRVSHKFKVGDIITINPSTSRFVPGGVFGNLPVQAPTKNLQTTAALGLKVPQVLLAIADKVVE